MSRSWVKASAIAVVVLALAVFSVATITTYAKQDRVSRGLNEVTPPAPLPKPVVPSGLGKGLGLWLTRYVELSEGFKATVKEILVSNDTTKSLLDKGFNITSIRPYKFKLVVLDDGSVVLKVTEVLVTLYERGESTIHVLVNYVDGKVTHIWGIKICTCPCNCLCNTVRPNTSNTS